MFDQTSMVPGPAEHDRRLRTAAAWALVLCFAAFYASLFLPIRAQHIAGALSYVSIPLLLGLRWRDLKSFHSNIALNAFCALLVYLYLSGHWAETAEGQPVRHSLRPLVWIYAAGLAVQLVTSCLTFGKRALYIWLAGTAVLIAATLGSFYWQHPVAERLEGYGCFINPNDLAILAAGALAVAIANFGGASRLEKALLGLAGGVFLLCIVLGHSRSGLLAAIVAVAVACILNRSWWLMAVSALLVAAAIVIGGDIWVERGTSFRTWIWFLNWLRVIGCGWLFGCGLGADSGGIFGDVTVRHIHSIPLGMLFYGGLIAFTLYLALIGYALWVAFRRPARHGPELLLLAGFTGTFATSNHILVPPDPLWIYLLGPLLWLCCQQAGRGAAPGPGGPRVPHSRSDR